MFHKIIEIARKSGFHIDNNSSIDWHKNYDKVLEIFVSNIIDECGGSFRKFLEDSERDSESFHKDSDGNLLLDENGEPISKNICICFAHSSSECVCGAWD